MRDAACFKIQIHLLYLAVVWTDLHVAALHAVVMREKSLERKQNLPFGVSLVIGLIHCNLLHTLQAEGNRQKQFQGINI